MRVLPPPSPWPYDPTQPHERIFQDRFRTFRHTRSDLGWTAAEDAQEDLWRRGEYRRLRIERGWREEQEREVAQAMHDVEQRELKLERRYVGRVNREEEEWFDRDALAGDNLEAAAREEGEWFDRNALADDELEAAALPAGGGVPMGNLEEDQMMEEAEGVVEVPDDRDSDEDSLFSRSG